ncbi:MAG: fibronectin type III domain-containing protein [Patescibacteria group bacterium]|nr:fibronectin type III domain-containing protein [Patescibacteria group bacterium]
MNNPELTKKIIAGVIGIFLSVLIIILSFRIFGTRAADFEPRDVVISNIEKNSVKISWSTGAETQGIIEYGTSPTALNFFAPEATKEKNHSVDLTLLSPSTTYYFIIRIGEKKYDNGGVPWSFTTKGIEKSILSTPTIMTSPEVSPTIINDNQSFTPTPFQRLIIDDNSNKNLNPTLNPTPSLSFNCQYNTCQEIKEKLGKGCTTEDYWKCIFKLTITPTPGNI